MNDQSGYVASVRCTGARQAFATGFFRTKGAAARYAAAWQQEAARYGYPAEASVEAAVGANAGEGWPVVGDRAGMGGRPKG